MTECDEVAAAMTAPAFADFDAAIAFVRGQMPDEGHTIVNNVAWSLYQSQRDREAAEAAPPAPRTVRSFSAVGPCITLGLFVRETAQFLIYRNWRGGERYDDKESRVAKRTPARYSGAHVEPCRSCRDHAETSYRHGYMD